MDNFLRKIKLIDSLTVELKGNKSDFIRKFRQNVEESDLSYSDSFFEVFKSSPNEYKGNIDNHVFALRRKAKLFDTNRNFAVVEGKMTEKSDKLILEADIKAIRKSMKFFFIFFILVFIIIITGAIIVPIMTGKDALPLGVLPFVFLYMLIIIAVPYFRTRRSITRMKYDLERDFAFWMN